MTESGFTAIAGKVLKYGTVALVTSPLWVPALFVGYVGFLASKAAFRHPWKTVGVLTLTGTLAYGVRSGALDRGWHELRDAHADKQRISQLEEQLDQTVSTYEALSRQQREEAQETGQRISALASALERRVQQYEPAPQAVTSPIQHLTPPQRPVMETSPPSPTQPLVPPPTPSPPPPLVSPLPLRSIVERPISPTHPGMIEESSVNYYYVKQDDTLSSIAAYVGASGHQAIARRNGIVNPQELMTGQLLRIPKEECRIYRPDIYVRVPDLASTTLSGDVRISDRFTDSAEVFHLNQQLGLAYSDTYKYPAGKRVVWHPK